jgi:uncharacterized protein YbbC (DUF1343 family)
MVTVEEPLSPKTDGRYGSFMQKVTLGLEALTTSPPAYLKGQRVGLLCNAASLDSSLVHARQCLHDVLEDGLCALFSPQHGLFAEKQDNMVESDDRRDPLLGIPVFSLYSNTRRPTQKMLDTIDILLVDLQDVGTRVYTFIYTMSYCMEEARRYGKKVVVLDRPNPIGGELVEGNCLQPEWSSFVGRYPIPMRHGLTIGELARLFNDAYGIGCDLEVIPMQGWRREMLFADTGLPWVAPSPNMPTAVTAMIYPGQVIWEGTNISEGRGTTQPFELFGAPFIDTDQILEALGGSQIPGGFLRAIEFEPTAQKWRDQRCHGFQLHVTNPHHFKPYRTSLELLQAFIRHHGDAFDWKSPPYEYEYEKTPIDLILGSQSVRKDLAAMVSIDTLETSWMDELDRFDTLRHEYYLYP